MADGRAVVAIPANNEAERIGACLAALAAQRDRYGAPLASGTFEILVFANNCTDATAERVAARVDGCPHPVRVVAETLPPHRRNAGWARKRAMDLAAEGLRACGRTDGLILTTDADSIVGSTWVDATLAAFAGGADAVAGYIDAHPDEIARLGPAFVTRGRVEDRYLRLIAEVYALCDPRAHDPWPNHRVSSGASLAVTLPAYLAIGGLPPKPVGEDAALTEALEDAGFKVRHAMDVCVSTSCRFDGRAPGGAADTMRHRHAVAEAPCDGDLEPARAVLRRASAKGRLRRLAEAEALDDGAWAPRLGLSASAGRALLARFRRPSFEALWREVSAQSPALRRGGALRPSDLPLQIARAERMLRALRERALSRATAGRDGTRPRARPREPVAA